MVRGNETELLKNDWGYRCLRDISLFQNTQIEINIAHTCREYIWCRLGPEANIKNGLNADKTSQAKSNLYESTLSV